MFVFQACLCTTVQVTSNQKIGLQFGNGRIVLAGEKWFRQEDMVFILECR